MERKKIKVTIKKDGAYTLEAQEGFSGTSCVEQTQDLEIAIGGSTIDEGKTSEYYNPEDDSELRITFDE